MGTQKQADNVAAGQLMAMFGETLESTEAWIKKLDAEKSSVLVDKKDSETPPATKK